MFFGSSKIGLKKILRIPIMEDKKLVSSNSVECRKAERKFAREYHSAERLKETTQTNE